MARLAFSWVIGARRKWRALAAALIPIVSGCGSGNIADCESGASFVTCSKKTDDEKAHAHLEKGEIDEAIALLSQLIEREPENYVRYSLLASAFAVKSGLDILQAAQNSATGGSGGGSFLDVVGNFLPDPIALGPEAYQTAIDYMRQAVEWLNAIPESLRDGTEAFTAKASVSFQALLYQTSYSVMIVRKFSVRTTEDGQEKTTVSVDELRNMPEEEAEAVIDNLVQAAANSPEGQGGAAKEKLDTIVEELNNSPGSKRDALADYYEKTKKPAPAP